MKKYLSLPVFITILSVLLISCKSNPSYANDIPCDTLVKSILQASKNDIEYQKYAQSDLVYILPNVKEYKECSVLYSTETNDINEIGVFLCESEEDASLLLSTLVSHIDDQKISQRAFISSYAPSELTKLDGAVAKKFGQYVIYLVTDPNDHQTIFKAVQNTLKAN